MRKVFQIGGFVAAAVLIAFGIVAIFMGVNGRHTVNNALKNEYIVGSADMTPAAIKAEAQKAGIAASVTLWPKKSVAGKKIDTGAKARLMAEYMRIHTLEATHGFTYAQMGIYTAKPSAPKSQLMPGGGTDNIAYALVDPQTKQPVHGRPARALRHRRRRRPPSLGDRFRSPRDGRDAPQRGAGTEALREAHPEDCREDRPDGVVPAHLGEEPPPGGSSSW
jgi:hypothetical protein